MSTITTVTFYRRTPPHGRPTGYAVIDLETTGLSPARDAVLEIGLVLADPDGRLERGWSTLVHPAPGRAVEVGPTRIHGLVAADLDGAPSLAQVSDLLVSELAGRAVVAHNARFDIGFLTAALSRTGHLVGRARVPRVCTMEWARHFVPVHSRRLTSCCEAAGVVIGRHHSALDDAEAAAGLLAHYLRVGAGRGETVPWSRTLEEAAAFDGWSWDPQAALAQRSRLVPRARAPRG
ncbi:MULTISPECIES: 3'-5' exonuclease [unclassified Actinomyces]|uniref:3'-5' exonuclease n=1 Tax=unclassified Actinomyces TaxID=2609248 RepID=UPI002018359E|nr:MULTISPECIES: 3'-5' exonuclease [unclassified Actinomyces]